MLSFLWKRSVQRGLLGGSQRWFTVFGVIGVVKLVRKLAGKGPVTVWSGELTDGTTLVISGHSPSTNMEA